MPISKVRTGAAELENLEIGGTEAARMPVGTTAQRANVQKGDIRFNDTNDLMEYYDGVQWKSIDSPPTISSISPTTVTTANASITITGSNFQSGATVKFTGNDGTEYNSPSVTVNSNTQITATTPASALTVANEPYDVTVTNISQLFGTLANSLDAGSSPSFAQAAGNIGTVYEDVAIGTDPASLSVSATDADGQSVTITSSDFSVSGLTFSNGSITGTPNVSDTYAALGVTHTFNAVATDGVNNTTRTFNILRKWYDGSTSALATTTTYLAANGINVSTAYLTAPSGHSGTGTQQYNVYLDTTNNDCYIKLPGEWLDQYGNYTQLAGANAWNWNSQGSYNRGFSITAGGAFDMDLRWSFTKYFVYMHSTSADDPGNTNPDDTRSFTEAQFTGITNSVPTASGGSNNAYTQRSETDANGNSLTLTPASLMLNAYSPSNTGSQTFAIGTPENIHPFKRGGEFAPNFIDSGSSSREIMFNMMPGSSYTNGTLTISNNAGSAATNYRNFPAGTGATTKFRVANKDDGSEVIRIPDFEIWVNGT